MPVYACIHNASIHTRVNTQPHIFVMHTHIHAPADPQCGFTLTAMRLASNVVGKIHDTVCMLGLGLTMISFT